MDAMSIAYCRNCILRDSVDESYRYKVRGFADDLYRSLKQNCKYPLYRVDIVLCNVLWEATGENANVLELKINGTWSRQFRLDDCISIGVSKVVELILERYYLDIQISKKNQLKNIVR